MKQMSFFLMVVFVSLLFFSACEKTEEPVDKTPIDIVDLDPPVITLYGDEEIDIVLNSQAFTDPGANAFDKHDGDLTHNIVATGEVDHTKIGTYEIEYSVSDQAGNQTVKMRIVNVIVDQSTYSGSWAVNEVVTGDNPDPSWNYLATVAISSVNPNRIMISNFGGFGSSFTANVDFDKFGNFTISNQPLTGSGLSGTITGSGTTAADGTTLTIEYDVNYADGDKDTGVGSWSRN